MYGSEDEKRSLRWSHKEAIMEGNEGHCLIIYYYADLFSLPFLPWSEPLIGEGEGGPNEMVIITVDGGGRGSTWVGMPKLRPPPLSAPPIHFSLLSNPWLEREVRQTIGYHLRACTVSGSLLVLHFRNSWSPLGMLLMDSCSSPSLRLSSPSHSSSPLWHLSLFRKEQSFFWRAPTFPLCLPLARLGCSSNSIRLCPFSCLQLYICH